MADLNLGVVLGTDDNLIVIVLIASLGIGIEGDTRVLTGTYLKLPPLMLGEYVSLPKRSVREGGSNEYVICKISLCFFITMIQSEASP